MVKTRTMKRHSLSRKRSYAKRVRASPCRGKGPAACRGRSGCKYTKGKKSDKYESWFVDLLIQEFNCSSIEAEDYCEILYSTKEGRENIKYICEKYGIDKKQITKLKLKL